MELHKLTGVREKELENYFEIKEKRKAYRIKDQTEEVDFSNKVLDSLWENYDYSKEGYESNKPTDEDFENMEKYLGCKIPNSYKQLMKMHNGNCIHDVNCMINNDFKDHSNSPSIFILDKLFGLDSKIGETLRGENGDAFRAGLRIFPDLSVVIGQGEHDIRTSFILDFSDCENGEEPCVAYVNRTKGYEIRYIADTFQDFVNGFKKRIS